jgi:hypothetical protein
MIARTAPAPDPLPLSGPPRRAARSGPFAPTYSTRTVLATLISTREKAPSALSTWTV